jgi:hypothetical protein
VNVGAYAALDVSFSVGILSISSAWWIQGKLTNGKGEDKRKEARK